MLATLNKLGPYVLSLVRVVAGLIFFGHGSAKLLGWPETEWVPEMFALPWFAGVFELICGALIVIGYQTRWAGFVASGVMAFAYWIGHAPRDLYPVNNGGDAAILYCFFFFYLVFAGPGPLSIDWLVRRSRA